MCALHSTAANMQGSAVILINQVAAMLNASTPTAPTSMDNLINATSNTYATLKSQLQTIGGISEINQRPVVNELIRELDRLRAMSSLMATPAVVSGSNVTTATTGGTLTDATTYYFKIVAVDANGLLSPPSAQISKATGSSANTNTITLKNVTQINDAASYRIYVATTSETFTLGYFAVTKANMEGSTGGTYTGQSLTAGTIPTPATATAQTRALTDDDVTAAKAASGGTAPKTTTLITRIIANVYDTTAGVSASVSAARSAGAQWI